MESCTASAGIPRGVLQQAKREGCDAFDSHNRVSLGKLLRWLFRGGEDGDENANWPERLKRAQALKAETELEQMKGQLVKIDEVHAQQDRCCSRAVAILVQKFETELPPKLDGCPAVDIATANRAALDEVRLMLGKKETYA